MAGYFNLNNMLLLPEYTQTTIDSNGIFDKQYIYVRERIIEQNRQYPMSPLWYLLHVRTRNMLDGNFDLYEPTRWERFTRAWNRLLDKLKFYEDED